MCSSAAQFCREDLQQFCRSNKHSLARCSERRGFQLGVRPVDEKGLKNVLSLNSVAAELLSDSIALEMARKHSSGESIWKDLVSRSQGVSGGSLINQYSKLGNSGESRCSPKRRTKCRFRQKRKRSDSRRKKRRAFVSEKHSEMLSAGMRCSWALVACLAAVIRVSIIGAY